MVAAAMVIALIWLPPPVAKAAAGTVVAGGRNDFGEVDVPPGLTNVTAISAFEFHNLALKEDGAVVPWGYGHNVVPPRVSNVTAIAAGGYHSLALKENGAVDAVSASSGRSFLLGTIVSGAFPGEVAHGEVDGFMAEIR
jgi:hypothetical protein